MMSSIDSALTWMGAHPMFAGIVAFLVCSLDTLLVVGLLVPTIPLLLGIGMLVGLGQLNGWYALACCTVGGICGDTLNFWLGRRYGPQLRSSWPFSRYPQWLDRGESMFRRRGAGSLVMARFIGGIRAIVPAIAGMLGMPWMKFLPVSIFGCLFWSACHLVPAWLFGASLNLLSAVAGRLALVIALLLALLVLIWWLVRLIYDFFAPRTARMLEQALAWSHRHPVLGRYSEALIDPNRPESASLLFLAVALLAAGWGFFTLLLTLAGRGKPLALDLLVHQGMFTLRTPLADTPMAVLASVGDWPVLVPAAIVVLGWLLWRRRQMAALHWVVAIAFGLLLTTALDYLLQVPKPPASIAAPGFSFPSVPVTMATIVFGFFAVLVAREMPSRQRLWPYLVATLLVATSGFARLYLGAHWLSDVVGGILLGSVWVALLGIAYRRRVVRAFWITPLGSLFFGTVFVALAWYGPRHAATLLHGFDPPLQRVSITEADWRARDWLGLPARRNETNDAPFAHARAWPLNVQYAGDLSSLQQRLLRRHWSSQSTAGWIGMLQIFNAHITPATLAVLPSSLEGRTDALLLRHPGTTADTRVVLRLWPAAYRIEPGARPLWIGTVQTVQFEKQWNFLSYWRALPDDSDARLILHDTLGDALLDESMRGDSRTRVMRFTLPAGALQPSPPLR
jgi:membrane protein DedA with SNARE-associated domain